MQIRPVAAIPATPNLALAEASRRVPAPAAAKVVASAPPSLEHVGTIGYVSKDGRYGYIDSEAFRSVFVRQSSLETPGELRRPADRVRAGGVGLDPNHMITAWLMRVRSSITTCTYGFGS